MCENVKQLEFSLITKLMKSNQDQVDNKRISFILNLLNKHLQTFKHLFSKFHNEKSDLWNVLKGLDFQ